MPKIESELAIKKTFLANIKQFQEVNTCLAQEILNKHLAIKRLFNSSEIGLSLKSIPSGEYFNYHDTFVYNKGFRGGDLFVIGNRAETFFPHLKSNFFYHNSEHITQGRCGFVEYYYIKDEI
ncbi:hypothetical protein [Sulfurospirillum diekertiae]|nr:hypothetical protein [Sulfurospirillum diekertiae]ASC94317.1 hypothetical protein Sdiek2_2311 [Sulfurospirillum diekertiae]